MKHRPLRFCMVTTFYPPFNTGGDGIFVHRLSNELARRGHSVDVIHAVDAFRLLSPHAATGPYVDHPNVTVHGLAGPGGPLSPLAAQQTGRPLLSQGTIRRILDQPYDVIHYHNVSLIGGPKILEMGVGVKLYTMHEYWLVCPTHTLFKFKREACYEPACLPCVLSYHRPPQLWRYGGMIGAAVKHIDAFLAPSTFCADIHRDRGLDLPVSVLPTFAPSIELAEAREPTPGETSAEPFFLFVGRLETLKGLQTILPLFQRYTRAELWIAGAGTHEAELRAQAGSAPNIRFLGACSEAELQPLYRRAVALIVPSICFEVFPQVVLEAFRQQTPVIVRNLGGTPEAVRASGGGFVFDTDAELLSAMDRLLDEPALRLKLGDLGFDAVRGVYSADHYIARYLELIEQIADRRQVAALEVQRSGGVATHGAAL